MPGTQGYILILGFRILNTSKEICVSRLMKYGTGMLLAFIALLPLESDLFGCGQGKIPICVIFVID